MKLVNYIKSLVGVTELATMQEDLNVTMAEINDTTIPAYANASLFGAKYSYRHRWSKEREKTFTRAMGNALDKRLGMVGQIHQALTTIPERLQMLEDYLARLDSPQVARDGMTYPVAIVIRFGEVSAFYSRYARKLLLCLYAYETDMILNKQGTFPYSKAELLKIEQQFDTFVSFTRILVENDAKQMKKVLESIPDATVDLSDDDATYAPQVNTLKLGFVPYTWNPIYHLGITIAEWQASRYDSAKLEKQSLELRLLQMKQAQAGQSDAATDKTIEMIEDRLQKVNYKLAKMESDYA